MRPGIIVVKISDTATATLTAFFEAHGEDFDAVRWYVSLDEDGVGNVLGCPSDDTGLESLMSFRGNYEDGFFNGFDFEPDDGRRKALIELAFDLEREDFLSVMPVGAHELVYEMDATGFLVVEVVK